MTSRRGRRRGRAPVAADGWVPLCMDGEEWADWQALNPILPLAGGGTAERPCVDCPASYAAVMRAEGRCNGEPGMPAAPSIIELLRRRAEDPREQ